MGDRGQRRVLTTLAGRPGVVVALLAIVALCGVLLTSSYRSRLDAIDKAAHQVTITADALETHARAVFSAQTVALNVLAHEFSQPGGDGALCGADLLRQVATGLAQVSNVMLIDRDGVIRQTAWDLPEGMTSVADQPYFQAHRDDASTRVRVGPPVPLRLGQGPGPSPGQGPVFTVTRRLDTADGAFNGVVLIGVRPQVFSDFFHSLDIGGAGLLGLVAEDGTVLAREPQPDPALGADVAISGLFPQPRSEGARDATVVVSPIDRVARVVAVRHLSELKLTVLAGMAVDDALAAWRIRLQYDAALVLPMLTVLAVVLAGLVSQTRAAKVSEAAAVEARDALSRERQLFIGGPVVVFQWRAAEGWPIDYVSPNVEQHWGYPADSLRDRPVSYLTLLDAADVERVHHEVTQLTTAGRPCFEQEYRIRRADGVVRWVYDFTIVGRNADGSPASYLGYLLDITERKEMERLVEGERDFIRTVINSLPGVFYVVDPDGRFELVNDSFSRITGYATDEILRRGLAGLLREAGGWTAAIQRVFETGSAQVEALLVTSDGRELPYYFTGVRFDGPGGRRLVGMGLDVSARKHMEEAIRRSNEELESFAYIASHDLQEPLRSVTTFVQLLKREYGAAMPAEAVEYMDFAIDGALRMSHLIRDLLQYSRAGRSRVSLDAVCRLDDAVEAAIALLTSAITESGAEVVADPLPTVRGDTDQLARLFQNLIGNALKYRHKERRPEVRVTAQVSGDWATVAVADNGIGIDPDYHHKIFQVFQRLHARSDYEGTGIGLAICDKIVAAHGGRLWVESEAGTGATFKFTLPLARAAG